MSVVTLKHVQVEVLADDRPWLWRVLMPYTDLSVRIVITNSNDETLHDKTFSVVRGDAGVLVTFIPDEVTK